MVVYDLNYKTVNYARSYRNCIELHVSDVVIYATSCSCEISSVLNCFVLARLTFVKV